MKLEITIPPVQGPHAARRRVAQPGNREPRRFAFTPPRRADLDDRHVPGRHISLHLHLFPQVLGNALITPAPDARHVNFGDCHGLIVANQRAD